MALKKSQLYSSLWKSCDELRGGMDASQYKDYVLTLLFVKYVSDKASTDPDCLIEVPEGGSFKDMLSWRGKPEIGDELNKIIFALAQENELEGVINVSDFNDEDKLGKGKDMVARLTKLLNIFKDLDFSSNRAEGDDLLGDAYEYLMRHFATESGKSKGQFYTPAEVSRILAKVIGITSDCRQDQTIYDPTCGSGSLLLKAADEAPRGLTVYGQEYDNATWALSRMNMILHGYEDAEIAKGNTLSSPEFKDDHTGKLKTFDFAVANPPFSTKSWSTGFDPEHDEFGRFDGFGIPPDKNGDYAFMLHIVRSLKSNGKGAVILPHGVLFRGNKEASIRKELIKRGTIKGIIGLPANLFYGTGIPACIIVLDKEGAAERKEIFMVDASKGFIKDGNKNRLRNQDLHKIVDVFTKQIELTGYSCLVKVSEIANEANDYNLNLPRYIDSSESEDIQDLSGHLLGGIPQRDIDELQKYWDILPSLRKALFEPAREGYVNARVEASKVKATILVHPEYQTYNDIIHSALNDWKTAQKEMLQDIAAGVNPKDLIHSISEDLLNRFASLPLIDKYQAYQRLMDYWEETMQDDVYMLVADAWGDAGLVRELIVTKGEKLKEVPDLIIGKKKYKCDLIPPALIVARYFDDKAKEILDLEAERDLATAAQEEYMEEHSGEDGLLEEAKTDSGKISQASLKARLKLSTDADEKKAIKKAIALLTSEATLSKKVKEAQAALDLGVLDYYDQLSVEEIKTLVIEDKWYASVSAGIDEEIQRLTQNLASRVKELEERYADTMTSIENSVSELSEKVNKHLSEMGIFL